MEIFIVVFIHNLYYEATFVFVRLCDLKRVNSEIRVRGTYVAAPRVDRCRCRTGLSDRDAGFGHALQYPFAVLIKEETKRYAQVLHIQPS